jgi:hypothetical protein
MLSVQYVYIPQHRSDTQTVPVVSNNMHDEVSCHVHIRQSKSLLTICEQSPADTYWTPGWHSGPQPHSWRVAVTADVGHPINDLRHITSAIVLFENPHFGYCNNNNNSKQTPTSLTLVLTHLVCLLP